MVGRLAFIGSSCTSRSVATDSVLMGAFSSSLSYGHSVRWSCIGSLSASGNTFERSKDPPRSLPWCCLFSAFYTISALL